MTVRGTIFCNSQWYSFPIFSLQYQHITMTNSGEISEISERDRARSSSGERRSPRYSRLVARRSNFALDLARYFCVRSTNFKAKRETVRTQHSLIMNRNLPWCTLYCLWLSHVDTNVSLLLRFFRQGRALKTEPTSWRVARVYRWL